jgi:hypothetical protein
MLITSRQHRTLRWLLGACLTALFVTRAAGTPPFSVEIDLQEQRAYLLRHGRMILESPISSGRSGFRTPTGSFRVLGKNLDHRSSLYGKIVDARGRTLVADADADMPVPRGAKFVNAPMRYFVRFTGGIGTHAGHLPGYAASHGCVRMPEDRARAFFEAVEVGTPVTVFGGSPRLAERQVPRRRVWEREPSRGGWMVPGSALRGP